MTIIQSKKFNISGPCNPLKHYMISALPRLPDIKGLIGGEEYFVLHAPRQSGKTTVMREAVKRINEEGLYYAMYCSVEELRTINDEDKAMYRFVDILDQALSNSQVETLKNAVGNGFQVEVKDTPGFNTSPIKIWLKVLCSRLEKDVVVFFDEVDCLEERVLLSFLSQLRVGYVERDTNSFPRSIALIGMRNIRDYKVKIRPDSETMGSASPFNIITEALTLANFTQEEIKSLYNQHTLETGQLFEDGAVERAWYWSEGQPWLVNALARQAVDKILRSDYETTVTSQHMDQAADNLMKLRDTHIDSLLARLREPRVRRFIEPMVAFLKDSALKPKVDEDFDLLEDDLQYCLDLGLIKEEKGLRPANPIYASVIVRYLNKNIQRQLTRDISEGLASKWMDGRSIDMTGLLKEFQQFWALKSEKYFGGLLYIEAGPHILLSAFLQRVVNGGATVIEEYADGLGYADIVVKYAGQNYVIELKIKDNQESKAKSNEQLLRYMDGLLVKEGWLVIFDRKSEKSWTKKITWETVTMPEGQIIHVVGC